jgi:hypothetical protein
MNLLRTVINIPKPDFQISHSKSSVFIGSCFADNIGLSMKQYKFPVEHNPFGVQYNPISVNNNLEYIINNKVFVESDLYLHNDQWHSFNHYSAFSNTDKSECLKQINSRIDSASKFLQSTSYLFVTFGTALVYEFRKSGQIVANCHKIPANEFKRYLLNTKDIVDTYKILYKKLKAFNPEIKLILTVSPIRHWKDGAELNQVSKSILLLSIYQLREEFPEINYFPVYEIFMDELRDYRFYGTDMLHPSETAVDFIWNKFIDTYIDEKSQVVINDIEKINKAINHKPFDVRSKSYKKFIESSLEYIEVLQKKYPYLNFNEEKEFFIKRQNN